jgi:NADPH:quinone reductase-like Zn-dependent oxidoreductase
MKAIVCARYGSPDVLRVEDIAKPVPGRREVLVLGSLPDLLQMPWVSLTSDKRVIAGPAAERPEDVRFLAELAAAGRFRPVIDRRYRFEQIAEAHRHVDTGRKRGSVVVTLV